MTGNVTGKVTRSVTSPLTTSPEFQAYLEVRAAVERSKGAHRTGEVAEPSAYWAEELEQIDYLADASPLIVRKLRHHAFHITGIRPYDYRDKGDDRRTYFAARLQALRTLGGDGLLVPEADALGGFGYVVDGRLLNVDTLKFYEVLIGMERSGVLPALRTIDRPVVCEIGAGWGGFAYQFKTLFPRATYIVVDFAEVFLFSATYLGTLFPDAAMAFVGTRETPTLADARGAELVFVPHTRAHEVSGRHLDLTVNMVSFQEMTGAQVREYAALAAAAGCPLLYSLNRERSPYNTELDSVSAALSERYVLTEVSVLGTDYTSATKKPPKAGKPVERTEFNYRHFVGRLDERLRGRADRAAAQPAAVTAPQASAPAGPRVILGMTLYNKARYLPEALDSLLSQTFEDFALVLLDDASEDDTERVAREYAARDPRVRYVRHASRRAMIATWREVAETAMREHPSAEYFAWASDHDRWHPQWLERLVAELDNHPGTVLAYPATRRIGEMGEDLGKTPRYFDTAGLTDIRARWRHFCRESAGSGDMVYGVMQIPALVAAGIFRPVLRPDKLLVAELALQGQIRQVPDVLWFRRETAAPSVTRQGHTLVLAGDAPAWFTWPPSLQHVRFLYRTYVDGDAVEADARLDLSRAAWLGMLLRYETSYGWKHFRKSGTFHRLNRTMDQAVWVRKISMHHVRRLVYETLVGLRVVRGRLRRAGRRAVYEVLVAGHRMADAAAWLAGLVWRRVVGASRRVVYRVLVLTRRVGLRGGRTEAP